MFVLVSQYSVPIEKVDSLLAPHLEFLKKYYSLNKMVISGRLKDNTGGVIICNVATREELNEIFKEDPFVQENVGEYKIYDFSPRMYIEELEAVVKK